MNGVEARNDAEIEIEAQAILSQRARSFAPATRLLRRQDRLRVARLYALCRIVDDLADKDGSTSAVQRLGLIADALQTCSVKDPIASEARLLFEGRGTGFRAFGDLVGGIRGDLGRVEIADVVALDAYTHAVAGTVGIMMASLFDVPGVYHAQAADLGKAMQLTNICRDVAEDAVAGRRYLPATLCPWTPEDIASPNPAVRADVQSAVGILLIRADELYVSGQRGLASLPPRVRLAVAIASALYRGINGVLRERDCDPTAGRVYVPTARKLRLAVSAGIGLIRGHRRQRCRAQREDARA